MLHHDLPERTDLLTSITAPNLSVYSNHCSCARRVPPVPCEQGVVTIIFTLWLVWPWVICFVLGEISCLSPSPSVWMWVKTGRALWLIQFELIAAAGLGSRVTAAFRASAVRLCCLSFHFTTEPAHLWCVWCCNSVNYPISATCVKLFITCITLTVRVRSYFCYSHFPPVFVLATFVLVSLLLFFLPFLFYGWKFCLLSWPRFQK